MDSGYEGCFATYSCANEKHQPGLGKVVNFRTLALSENYTLRPVMETVVASTGHIVPESRT